MAMGNLVVVVSAEAWPHKVVEYETHGGADDQLEESAARHRLNSSAELTKGGTRRMGRTSDVYAFSELFFFCHVRV